MRGRYQVLRKKKREALCARDRKISRERGRERERYATWLLISFYSGLLCLQSMMPWEARWAPRPLCHLHKSLLHSHPKPPWAHTCFLFRLSCFVEFMLFIEIKLCVYFPFDSRNWSRYENDWRLQRLRLSNAVFGLHLSRFEPHREEVEYEFDCGILMMCVWIRAKYVMFA